MTLKIPIPRKPNAPFAFKPRGLSGFFAKVPQAPLPSGRSPFGVSGLCGFYVNMGQAPVLPAKSIFPQFVKRQNGGQCSSCQRPCGSRRGLGDDSTDFGSFGSDQVSVDPSTGLFAGTDTYTPTTTSELELSPIPTDLVGQSGITAPPTTPAVAGDEWMVNSSGNWVQAPTSQVNAYLGTSSAKTASPAVVASRLAENAAEGISSVASGATSGVTSAVLSAAQLAALKANPNLTTAQLQALAPPSGVSQWLAQKSTMFPSETNGSLLMVGGILAAAGLVFANIAGGKKRR